jgi:hypothetical protein
MLGAVMVDDTDDRPPPNAWAASAREWRANHPFVEIRKPNGAERHVDMPSPPDRAPPIGEEIDEKPNFRTLKEFCAEFRPISYAVAALMRAGSLYTLHRADGRRQNRLPRPTDARHRHRAQRAHRPQSDERPRRHRYRRALVVVDTWQAYFDGKDPNNNAEAVAFTRRFRPLAVANTVVLINAHPPKQAADTGLLPYGGGATLNEVDSNFTLRADEDGLYRFHWLGKIRGLNFDPIHFKIEKLDSPDVITVEGARVQIPVMFPIDEEAVEAREQAFAYRDLELLKALAADPAGSIRKWALVLNLTKRAVEMALKRITGDRLVVVKAKRWTLTKDGEGMVNEGQK